MLGLLEGWLVAVESPCRYVATIRLDLERSAFVPTVDRHGISGPAPTVLSPHRRHLIGVDECACHVAMRFERL